MSVCVFRLHERHEPTAGSGWGVTHCTLQLHRIYKGRATIQLGESMRDLTVEEMVFLRNNLDTILQMEDSEASDDE